MGQSYPSPPTTAKAGSQDEHCWDKHKMTAVPRAHTQHGGCGSQAIQWGPMPALAVKVRQGMHAVAAST
jgi:hypothetical protein